MNNVPINVLSISIAKKFLDKCVKVSMPVKFNLQYMPHGLVLYLSSWPFPLRLKSQFFLLLLEQKMRGNLSIEASAPTATVTEGIPSDFVFFLGQEVNENLQKGHTAKRLI